MSAFPKTAAGLVSLGVFVGYLSKLILNQNTQPDSITKTTQNAQIGLVNALNQINNGTSYTDAIFGILNFVGNFLVMLAGFVAGIFISFAVFITTVSGLPIVISQILITIFTLGLMFALLSKVIQI
jgi:Na+/melibiose symporter-like transporter